MKIYLRFVDSNESSKSCGKSKTEAHPFFNYAAGADEDRFRMYGWIV